jgi:hypothetical protein
VSDFHVIVDDIQGAASIFGTEADSVDRLHPKFAVGAPDCGDHALTSSLGLLLEAFDVLNGSLAHGCHDAATKLRQTQAQYDETDQDVRRLFQRLMS